MPINDKNNIIHGSATITVDGTALGWTQGGVTLRKSNDYLDVEADQVFGVISKKRTAERMFVTTTLIEALLDVVRRAFAEATSQTAGSGDLTFGSSSPTEIEHNLVLTGPAPNGQTRTYTFYRAIIAEDVEHVVGARDAIGVYPVGFELLKDPGNAFNFGYYADA